MELLLFWIAIGVLCAVIAPSRGRSAAAWFCLGALLSPLALIALLALPKLTVADGQQRAALGGSGLLGAGGEGAAREAVTKECPRCAETIKARAAACRFCGHEFPIEADAGIRRKAEAAAAEERRFALASIVDPLGCRTATPEDLNSSADRDRRL
jgi:hypothetical protein